MATRMLIDARHLEETRVVVLKGNQIEEFDFESADHKQIKGNIYLAKVTRVEPSLQAAFVDFGGNRHGFLAFSEIHPDYYQIPQQDREALLAEEEAHAEEEAALRALEDEQGDESESDADHDDNDDENSNGIEEVDTSEADDVSTIEDGFIESDDDAGGDGNNAGADTEDTDSTEDDVNSSDEEGSENSDSGDYSNGNSSRRRRGRRQGGGSGSPASKARAKAIDDLRSRRMALRRRYKIQDVIHRRQVLLVQVVKEERGNKGAALTTYLSLAGRYCVLMPNSSHGGGISRKISSVTDRKRLKQIVAEMNLPRSMGLIVRTAGLQRNKAEIKRDFDYLARLWDEIREKTLSSAAPTLIHSDSDLIKRAIRDIYNREIEEVIVEGEEGYRSARAFMKLLMPSHMRKVKAYSDPVPLLQRFGAEDQLSAMYDPVVQLKSGGYLVINPTEALVSIDINSGRATKEHGIEQTALATNLEAAKEIARQLRLRDMAGLVVIDFIDMEYNSNIRKVEKAMKDALKNDRARIQVGRISGFGLMEMSRQRLRTGVLEATTRECPHCDGTGLVRTASSAGLSALRLIEDEAAKGKGTLISLYASTEAAVYLLNAKRADLMEIESRYGVSIEILPEGEQEGAKMRVVSSGSRPTSTPRFEPILEDVDDSASAVEDDDEESGPSGSEAKSDDESSDSENGDGRRKRRPRRRGGRNRGRRRSEEAQDENGNASSGDAEHSDEESAPDIAQSSDDAAPVETERTEEEKPAKPARRRSRARRTETEESTADEVAPEPAAAAEKTADEPSVEGAADPSSKAIEEETEAKPRRTRRRRKTEADDTAESQEQEKPEAASEGELVEKPRTRTRRKVAEPVDDVSAEAASDAADEASVDEALAKKPAPKPRPTRRKKVDEPTAEAEQASDSSETPALESVPEVRAALVAERSAANDPVDSKTKEAAPNTETQTERPTEPPRKGWWQRTFGN